MSEPRPLAASIGIVPESTRRRRLGYGFESSSLNPFMGADPPSYEPYEVFDDSATFDEDDGIYEREVEMNHNSTSGIGDFAKSCQVFYALIERLQAGDCLAIMVWHHDVEHRNIVNLI